MNKFIIFFVVLLAGCAAIDVSETDPVKELIGACYKFKEAGELVRTEGSDKERVMKYTSSYLFLSSVTESHHRENNGGAKLLKILEPGSKLKIVKVINYPYGSAGRCWVVKADLLAVDTGDELVEIPSCWVWDEPIWVSPKSPDTLKGNQKLEINTPVLEPTSCS